MKNLILLSLTIILISAGSCSKKEESAGFNLDESFLLAYNGTSHLENNPGIKIQFSELLEDSRCPTDVQCVWAGRVALKVIFSQNGNQQTGTLALGEIAGTSYSNETTFGDYTVKLLTVKPAPKSDQSISLDDYQIEILVKKSK